jgi:acyl-CoA thioester hydrolase
VKREPLPEPPTRDVVSVVTHNVAFHETDAMGIMHHAEYVNLFERARVAWLAEHDVPYREWLELDRHFAVTGVDVRYLRAVRFDDLLEVSVWVQWVSGARLCIGYQVHCDGQPIANAQSEHGMVDGAGKPARIPSIRRLNLQLQAADDP